MIDIKKIKLNDHIIRFHSSKILNDKIEIIKKINPKLFDIIVKYSYYYSINNDKKICKNAQKVENIEDNHVLMMHRDVLYFNMSKSEIKDIYKSLVNYIEGFK